MPKPSSRTHYLASEYDTFAMSNKIETVRTSREYTLETMAKLTGATVNQISKVERHITKNISKQFVETYSKTFNIPLQTLVVKRNEDNKDYALWEWVRNEKESLRYLQAAYYQYLRDTGKIS